METSASKGVHFAPLDNSVKRRGGEGVRCRGSISGGEGVRRRGSIGGGEGVRRRGSIGVRCRGGEGVRFAVSRAIANSGKRRIMSKAISIVFYMRSKK